MLTFARLFLVNPLCMQFIYNKYNISAYNDSLLVNNLHPMYYLALHRYTFEYSVIFCFRIDIHRHTHITHTPCIYFIKGRFSQICPDISKKKKKIYDICISIYVIVYLARMTCAHSPRSYCCLIHDYITYTFCILLWTGQVLLP